MRYTNTVEKTQHLRSLGYQVIEMWECAFRKTQNENSDVREFVQSQNFVEPLNPKDAFFGGRTEMFKKYCLAEGGNKIRYYDANSLYPFICKYGKFPTGHPVIYTDNFPTDISEMTGFIKCVVLPPKERLYTDTLHNG